MDANERLEQMLLILSKQMVSVEMELIHLKAAVVVLKGSVAAELHRDDPQAFLAQLRLLERKLLEAEDKGLQVKKEALDRFDALLHTKPEQFENPDA
jgi:hypothetical protein